MAPTTSSPETPVWFVTGASSGFGHALTAAVLERGHRVVATSRRSQDLRSFANQFPDRTLVVQLDVADADAARDAVRQGVSRFGRIDVVFNNAGFGFVGAIEELTDDELREQLDVNLFGVINVTRAALPQLRKQRSGHFVQMSSLNGVEALPGAGYYVASKFAIEGFSETLAAEVARLGIKVTVVEPAPFRTRFLDDKSAKWACPMREYAESVGKSRETLHALNGKQPGDPARAALAIIQAVEAEKPPLRLPLGRMATDHIRAVLAARLKELDACAEVAAAADFRIGEGDVGRVHESLVRRAYAAFNSRAVDDAVDLMDPEVAWPDVQQGGFLHGREQVREHWREQFDHADPHIDVSGISEKSDGSVEARIRQIIRKPDGTVSDDQQVHVFTITNNRIKRMDVKASG